jgi:hypothetical protein
MCIVCIVAHVFQWQQISLRECIAKVWTGMKPDQFCADLSYHQPLVP